MYDNIEGALSCANFASYQAEQRLRFTTDLSPREIREKSESVFREKMSSMGYTPEYVPKALVIPYGVKEDPMRDSVQAERAEKAASFIAFSRAERARFEVGGAPLAGFFNQEDADRTVEDLKDEEMSRMGFSKEWKGTRTPLLLP
jgi:hypothetical protein